MFSALLISKTEEGQTVEVAQLDGGVQSQTRLDLYVAVVHRLAVLEHVVPVYVARQDRRPQADRPEVEAAIYEHPSVEEARFCVKIRHRVSR